MNWRREWESLSRSGKCPMNTGIFRPSRTESVIWSFRIVSSVFVCPLPFSGFTSAMTLELTLAANDDVVRPHRNTRESVNPRRLLDLSVGKLRTETSQMTA